MNIQPPDIFKDSVSCGEPYTDHSVTFYGLTFCMTYGNTLSLFMASGCAVQILRCLWAWPFYSVPIGSRLVHWPKNCNWISKCECFNREIPAPI